MKSTEDSYLLSEVKWAISKEAGIVHPYLLMKDKFVYYDLFTHNILNCNGQATEQFSRHYKNVLFECEDTELLYCLEIKNNQQLSDIFINFPNLDISHDGVLDFYGKVYQLCTDTYVNDEDLRVFASVIKQILGIGEEQVQFCENADDPIYINYKNRRSYKSAM